MKNKYVKVSHISEPKFKEIVKLFSEDLSATQIANLTNLNRNTINRYLMLFRERIVQMGEDADKNIKLFEDNIKPNSLQITHPSGVRIKLFSQDIELPEKVIKCDFYLYKIHTEIDKIKCGDSVKIELIPQDDFRYSERYNLD